jgi:hypothetical protein
MAFVFKPAEELIDIGSLVQWLHRTRVPGGLDPTFDVAITWYDWHAMLRDEYYEIEIENGEWCFHGLVAELSAYRPRDPWRGLDVPDYIGPHGMRFFDCSQLITARLVRRNAEQRLHVDVASLIAYGDFVARVARLAPMPLRQVQIDERVVPTLLTIGVALGPDRILEIDVSVASSRRRRPVPGVRVWTSPSGLKFYAAAPPAWLRP